MEVSWTNILYLAIGAIIGFFSSIGAKYIEKYWEENNQKQKNVNILKALEGEIEEGIKRIEWLVESIDKSRISFSRIYTRYWQSTSLILSQNIENVEILNLLHLIYYRFDLINFNMEAVRFDRGAAFAKEYIEEVKENSKKLKKEIKKLDQNSDG